MNQLLDILKHKKLQFFFLFYILLLLPILSPLAENISILDKLAIFLVCGLLFMSISILSVFISSKSEKIIYSILLTISIIPGAIFLSYLLFAHVLLEQNSVTSLFETNPEESKEFVAYYLSIWVIVGVLVYTAIPIVMICKMKSFKRLKVKDHKAIFILSIIVLISIVGINRVSRSVYFINFYKTFVSYKLRVSYEIKTIKERQNQPFEVKVTHQDSLPQTIVIVIGESLTKRHMSLYGYARNTNPLLSNLVKNDQLHVYTDVVSPQVHTIPVMRSLLTMSDLEHPEYFTKYPSLFELFNRADYDTYLISNQEFSEKYRSSYDVLLTLAKNKYNVAQHKQHDDVVLDTFHEILDNQTIKNRLIVIHLIGNHMAYEFRYPKEYIVFNNANDNLVDTAIFRDKQAKKTIDKYDNSVLYNDFIINSVIKSLEGLQNQKTAMIYLSDHGEELYDYREFAGHAYEKVSPPMCEIPFMVWMSDNYKKNRSDLVLDINRPYSTQDFIYTISDMSGLEYEGYDDSRSLFSTHFEPKERFVGEKKYTKIKEKFDK
ncbi:sulfatase-like hydrolase/transferase [Dysgonomonas sp. ZJ279]|uniref:sulfatase-like hydrolase/transferase n=1 Tax=Dysgonomonas sp. ZJ279 TaxID=2709796 RepID=UPI0013EC046C|nr:sulfatase-like hydrolase/transferase [Dysgonomonas sp. ZJ279]